MHSSIYGFLVYSNQRLQWRMTELISPIGNGLFQMSLINGRIYLSKTIIKMRQFCC